MDILFKIANADFRNVSLTEKVTNNYPPPVYLRNLLALIQVRSQLYSDEALLNCFVEATHYLSVLVSVVFV